MERFGEAPWFPRMPERPGGGRDRLPPLRRRARDGAGEDVHWAVQHALVAQLPLDHVGRVERLGETLALLHAHAPGPQGPARHENESPLPLPPGLYDPPSLEVLAERHAVDFAAYGYAPPAAGPADLTAWTAEVAPLLPVLRIAIGDRERLGQLHRVAQRRVRRAQAAETRLETVSARQVGHARSPTLTNLEGETDFNVRWGWADGALAPGFTAVLRARDEARTLPHSLPPLLRAVERVVLIDNGSTDGTAAVARDVAAGLGLRRAAGGARVPVRRRALRRRPPRDGGGVGAQPRLLLQLVLRPRAHVLRAQVGRGHGPHRRGRGPAGRPRLAARGGATWC